MKPECWTRSILKFQPMISICIPIYNFDVRPLVRDLLAQADENTEIILIDDASENFFKETNRELKGERLTYIELEQNIGRSKIRNLFLNYAKKEFLLFLDCDSQIIDSGYLKTYQNQINADVQLICGGRVYDKKCPSDGQKLRWVYGITKESKPASERILNPNKSFMTNNFLIRRELLAENPFDERLTKYGHEDTLLGIELAKKGVVIQHIENPVLNNDVEQNEVFMEKTEAALDNLVHIRRFYEDQRRLEDHITLLQAVKKVEKWKLKKVFGLFYRCFAKTIRKQLISSSNPSMRKFDLYKMMYFLTKLTKSKK